jgi:large subunit ribosomal protein L24
MKRLKIGDQVKVITGSEKGKISTIKSVLRKKNQVVLENINVKIKHTKPVRSNEAGKIIQFEAPIDASNVMLCNNDGVISRIGVTYNNGSKQRKPKKDAVVL